MKRCWLAMLMGLALCTGAAGKEAAVPVPMMGAVEMHEDTSWIAIPEGTTVRSHVGVVTLDGTYQCCYAVGPQKARQDNREFSRDGESLTWHTLTPLNRVKAIMAVGIAIPAQGAVAASAIPSGTQFTWHGRAYRLTRCASSEGIHLLLDGDGRRLRHYYYYLGYDTEPDCDARVLNQPEQSP